MNREFEGLNEAEYGQLKEAIVLITVLIAGADGNIDEKEKSWAEKVAQIRGYTLPEGLKDFYKDVGLNFAADLTVAIEKYGGAVEARNEAISAELAKLNDVFPKINNREVAVRMYQSLLSFADHVAKASGGFLSWGRINVAEKKLLGLVMIDSVEDISE